MKHSTRFFRIRNGLALTLITSLVVSYAGCFSDDSAPPYFGRTKSPQTQEFRWSDGGLPQTFDPAFAAAPPDTDLIRAIFEGLTDYDPRTLRPVPGVATSWESSRDGRVWTFYLRPDARWSNGEQVTAHDFIRSWERTLRLGDQAPHTQLLHNIEGALATPPASQAESQRTTSNESSRAQKFGAEAVNERILRVHLQRPDLNFPALVAHPVFRPVKIGNQPLRKIGPSGLVSNGAFSLAKTETDRVLLERANNYWGKADITLERVAFVDSRDAETALASYRNGEIDAVTNAAFAPSAIKLLASFDDFRRATYGALTYYSFNTDHAPFDDVRVREALALAIDRDRISRSDTGGATVPAKKFLPDEMTESNQPVVGKADLLERDVNRAQELLAEAGFPAGEGFPKIRLLVNRNEQQRLVAQSVAAMWRAALNIETEIVMKSWDEYEAAIRAGEYDVVRRGLVMQTTDEFTNITMLFQHERVAARLAAERLPNTPEGTGAKPGDKPAEPIESEQQAIRELKAVPIYFASSYALVKPYVVGFSSNVLDAPSLKTVKMDTSWSEEGKSR